MSVSARRDIAVFAVVILLGAPTTAWAYIDPALGSYLFQLTIAGVLAGLYTLRRYSHVVAGFFRRKRENRESDPTNPRDGVE